MDSRKYTRGKYLRASDIDGELKLTIKSCGEELVGEERKLVTSFEEIDQDLSLNKKNNETITEEFSYETESWIGKKIILFKTTTNFQGKTVPAIRVRIDKEDNLPF